MRVRRRLRGMSRTRMGLGLLCASVILVMGCTRRYYRNAADRDVYGIEAERMDDWRWRLPARPVEADPRSRMADKNNPDREAIPPDDPAARQFQVSSRFPFEWIGWKKRGMAPVEDLSWQLNLPREPDGSILLNRETVMQIGVVNSREYQFNLENVYLQALALTLSRFQFMIQGFAQQSTFF